MLRMIVWMTKIIVWLFMYKCYVRIVLMLDIDFYNKVELNIFVCMSLVKNHIFSPCFFKALFIFVCVLGGLLCLICFLLFFGFCISNF
jgi:hypothetical protein